MWEGLREIEKPPPTIVLEEEEEEIIDMDEDADDAIMNLVLQMEAQHAEEEELDVQASAISAAESHTDKVLRDTASNKAAAPVVNSFLSKLKCTGCKSMLLTEAQFPEHLYHTLMATPQNMSAELPTARIGSVVRQIHEVGLPQIQGVLHEPGVASTFFKLCSRLPAVRQLSLCPLHNGVDKKRLVRDLAVSALHTLTKKITVDYAERHRKTSAPANTPATAKMQRVVHL